MELKSIPLEFPEGTNIIFGQSHFIKTVEDIYEVMVTTAPHVKFGVAFSEASGPCLIRTEGNDDHLVQVAAENIAAVGCGHAFLIVMKDGFPINVLKRVQEVQEVVGIFCATANPVEVIVAETGLGRGVMGVVDGSSPQGVEEPEDIQARHDLLRKIGYKR